MKQIVRLFVLLLSLFAMACSGGGDPSSTKLGTLSSALSGVSTEGATYRLRNAIFDVTGPDNVQLNSEDFLDQLEIVQQLTVGAYQIQLEPGWTLEREQSDGTFQAVQAQLNTPNPVDFLISDGQTTTVAFGFRVDQGSVVLGNGTLSVVINIDDTPVENTVALCSDGVDNDGDGDRDCADSDCAGFSICAPVTPVQGDLLITEVMSNPSDVPDADGEWFEVENLTGTPLLLDGCEIRDLGTDQHTITSWTIGAYARAVVVRNGDTSVNGGVSGDYVDDSMVLANGADEILIDCNATTVDSVAWTVGALAGASKELSNGIQDPLANDDVDSWCDATAVYGLSDRGTPGQTNGCP